MMLRNKSKILYLFSYYIDHHQYIGGGGAAAFS